MKQGANFSDANKIKKLAAKGLTVEEISFQLRIAESVVAGHAPDAPTGDEVVDPADGDGLDPADGDGLDPDLGGSALDLD